MSAWYLRCGSSAQGNTLIGIANSIVSVGFRQEETVVARDVGGGMNHLRCGDGTKRVLAMKMVFLGCL